MTIADVAQYAQRYKLPILAIASVLVFIVLWPAGAIGPGALAKSRPRAAADQEPFCAVEEGGKAYLDYLAADEQ